MRRFNSAKSKKSYTYRKVEIRKSFKEIMKETSRFQVDETNFDSAFQASETQHEGELIMLGHSWKKENKDLMTKVKSCIRKTHIEKCFYLTKKVPFVLENFKFLYFFLSFFFQ